MVAADRPRTGRLLTVLHAIAAAAALIGGTAGLTAVLAAL